MNEIKNHILTNWGECKLKPNVEETDDEIKLMVLYEDIGDEGILIRTKDGDTYEYGCFSDRSDGVVRMPELFKSKIDGIDGIAGKRIYKFDHIVCEKITKFWYDGRYYKPPYIRENKFIASLNLRQYK